MFSGHSQLPQDFPRNFSGLSKDFFRPFSKLSQDFGVWPWFFNLFLIHSSQETTKMYHNLGFGQTLPSFHVDNDRAYPPNESSYARLGWRSLKIRFHSRGIDMAWQPYAASSGSTESSCLWSTYHTFNAGRACPVYGFDSAHPLAWSCCSVWHRSCTVKIYSCMCLELLWSSKLQHQSNLPSTSQTYPTPVKPTQHQSNLPSPSQT